MVKTENILLLSLAGLGLFMFMNKDNKSITDTNGGGGYFDGNKTPEYFINITNPPANVNVTSPNPTNPNLTSFKQDAVTNSFVSSKPNILQRSGLSTNIAQVTKNNTVILAGVKTNAVTQTQLVTPTKVSYQTYTKPIYNIGGMLLNT